MSEPTSLLYLIVKYLEERGWRFTPAPTAVDTAPGTGSWWTRDEYKEWWIDLKTDKKIDRFVDLKTAIMEQIEHEVDGGRLW